MTELFQIEPVLSPRLLWKVQHRIQTHYAEHCPEAPWMAIQPFDKDNGKTIGRIMAESCRLYEDADAIGYGLDEDTALVELAKKLRIKLWNEV